ncbi:MAG: molybdopterin-dependent oxidoreductase [Candidatus Nanoarchaeia archaeon]
MRTICPYCGCGCSLKIKKDNKIIFNRDPHDYVSSGNPCVKGLTSYEILEAKDRIKQPLIKKGNKFVKTSWKNAYDYIYKKTKDIYKTDIAFLASSPSSNEDCFLFQKFARDYFDTDNIDSCARICHAASCYAFFRAFGITRMPSKFEDYEKADCILLMGTNPLFTYPVIFNRILKAKKAGCKLIYVGPFKNETAHYADLFIKIEASTDIALLNCVLNLLVEWDKVDVDEELREILKRYNIEHVESICKCSKDEIKKLALMISKSKNFLFGFGMGLTQHSYGSNSIFSAINLVLAKNGKIVSMRGKTNIQGVADMQCVPLKNGRTMVRALGMDNPVKSLFVMNMDPAKSLPNLNLIRKRFEKMFIVLISPFPNETMKYANVILPCCTSFEQEGTFTNAESRIRHFDQVIKPMYNSKPSWLIMKELANRFKLNYKYKNINDIWKDIKKLPGYTNLNEIKENENGKFVNYKIKTTEFTPVEFYSIEEKTSKKYPFVLTTERCQYRFCADELSSRSKTLVKAQKSPFVLINKEDAMNLNLKNNDNCIITSKVGEVTANIKINEDIPSGLLVAPFHFTELLINRLFPLELDITGEANLKRVAVNIEKY